MITGGRRASFLLFLGDLVAFAVSLYLALWIRYGVVPNVETLAPYGLPFTLLFIFWSLVFYSAGLYSKRTILFPSRLPDMLFRVQMANVVFAVLFFFFIPSFGITPKTILVLYFIISLGVISLWRLVWYPRMSLHHMRTQAVLLARGEEAGALFAEVNGNPRYGIEFRSRELDDPQAMLYVVDTAHPGTPSPDNFSYGEKQIISFEDMYEEVFDRIPLSKLEVPEFREHLVVTTTVSYDVLKRCIDIAGGILMGIVTLIATPFVALALQFEYPGSVFIVQTRLGEHGTRIRAYKFRSMRFVDIGAWKGETENKVTRVGEFLRRTSLDEFPQFINVLKGELSLIGPRNDVEALGTRLAETIPYYLLRYTVRPGITGWAQINQQYEQGNVSPQSIEETKVRLAYDFYYLKHRSFGLDMVIALKTVKRMFFRMSPS